MIRRGSIVLVTLLFVASFTEAAEIVVVVDDDDGLVVEGSFRAVPEAYSSHGGARFAHGAASNIFRFAPVLPVAGYYRVYAWWPKSASEAQPARYTIRHRGGIERINVAQNQGGGQWSLLGEFPFAEGAAHSVDLSAPPGAPFAADAVKFEYVSRQRSPLRIATTMIPLGRMFEPYHGLLQATGGGGSYHWFAAETLPVGLSLDSRAGSITGTPLESGAFAIRASVMDREGGAAETTLELLLMEPSPYDVLSSDIGAGAFVSDMVDSDLSVVIALIEATPEGEWFRLNVNTFSDVWTPAELRPLIGLSNPDPWRIIAAWSGFAWDRNRGELVIWGGGHANYHGNDVYRWRGSTRMWERASLPSEITVDVFSNIVAIDGPDAAPTSAHTYDNNIFLPYADRMLTFGGAVAGRGGRFMKQVDATTERTTGPYLFDPSKADPDKVGGTTGSHVMRVAPHPEVVGGEMWENRDIYVNIPGDPTLPRGGHLQGATAYSPENGSDVVYVSAIPGGAAAQELYKYVVADIGNPSSDTWEWIGRNFAGIGGQGAGAYDQGLNIFTRTSGTRFYFWDLNTAATPTDLVLFDPFDPTGELSGDANYGLDYDPIRNQYLLFTGFDVWSLKAPAAPSAHGWLAEKQPPPSLPHPSFDVGPTTGILGKWKYIPNLDGFMLLEDATAGNIWVYKPAGWIHPDTLVDGDGDSLPDAFELAHGLDATNPLDALLDPDGDGLTTRMEYSRGLDPIVPEATAPVIAPAGGTFDDVVIVSMSTFTSAAQIYFTVDGSTPSPASTLYSGPFVLLASSTVRARAVRTDFVDSAVTSATFTVTAATPGIIIDDLDANTEQTGSWQVSSGANPWADRSVYNNAGNTFRWLVAIAVEGTYEVYAWWTYHSNRSSVVPYRIAHAGGTTETIVDQREPSLGGQWNLIGTVPMLAGGGHYVEVSSENGQASADAVRLVLVDTTPLPLSVATVNLADGAEGVAYSQTLTALGGGLPYTWSIAVGNLPAGLGLNSGSGEISGTPTSVGEETFTVRVVDDGGDSAEASLSIRVVAPPTEIVIDDLDANTEQTGSWQVSSGANPWADRSVYNNAGNTFRWLVAIAVEGTYEVYAWWTYHSNRSSVVPYRIAHAGGTTETIVDQREPSLGGQWNLIGTVPMLAGGGGYYVEVSSENGQASADAVRLVLVDTTPLPLSVATVNLADGAEGVAYSQTLTALGGGPPYTWSIAVGNLPAGLGLNSGSGEISGTPTSVGEETFTVRVVDDGGDSAEASLSIRVVAPPTEIVIDDLDANTEQTGSWQVSSGANPWADRSVYNNAGNTFRWLVAIAVEGTYEVYAWWTYHSNRSSVVPYRIAHAGGTTETIVDQREPSLGGQWNLIGTVPMLAGGGGYYVEVSSENGQASADAVRLVLQ